MATQTLQYTPSAVLKEVHNARWEHFELVADAFSTLDLVEKMSSISWEKDTVEGAEDWKEFVELLCDEAKSEDEKKRLKKWRVCADGEIIHMITDEKFISKETWSGLGKPAEEIAKAASDLVADVIITPEYNDKTKTFRFTVRIFKRIGKGKDAAYHYLTAEIEKEFAVAHHSVASLSNYLSSVRSGSKTDQQRQNAEERKIGLAFSDSVIMTTFVAELFGSMLTSAGIVTVAHSKDEAASKIQAADAVDKVVGALAAVDADK